MRGQEAPRVFQLEPEPSEIRAKRPPSVYSPYDPERATIMLPTGRLEKDVKSFFRAIGLEFEDADRKYFIRVANMPVDFVMIKAREVPQRVGDAAASWGNVGVTGSDILWEQEGGLSILNRNSGEDLPLAELVPDFKPSSLYIGVSDSFVKEIQDKEGRDPELKDFAGEAVVTKLPKIAKEVLAEKGVRARVQPVSGAEEGWQYLNRGYFAGILGVIQTGKTVETNDIRVLEKFYDVSVRLVSANWERYDSRISRRELAILNDLREMTYVALQKKRTGL